MWSDEGVPTGIAAFAIPAVPTADKGGQEKTPTGKASSTLATENRRHRRICLFFFFEDVLRMRELELETHKHGHED